MTVTQGNEFEAAPAEPLFPEPTVVWVDAPKAERKTITIGIMCTRIFATLALLAIWCIFFATGLSSLSASRSQQLMYGELRANLSLVGQQSVPIGGNIKPGTPVALLEAPSIHLRYVVVEGTDSADLRAGPGHKRTTPLPGQAGVSVIYGKSVTYGAPFSNITDLMPGALITVTTGQGTFTYVVDKIRRPGDPIPDALPSTASMLRLVTAEGFSWRSGWSPDQVVYVDAIMSGNTVPTPAGRLTAVGDSENALQGDDGGLIILVLWLQLLLFAFVGATWARYRWGGGQTWLVSVPLLLACLWGVTNAAMVLMPNLL